MNDSGRSKSPCAWPHSQVVEEVFYGKGMTSLDMLEACSVGAGFESAEPELFRAVCDNNIALVERLLVEKHVPNAITQLKVECQGEYRTFSQYPLHRAVQTGNKDLVDILLKHGGNPNCRNGQGVTPMQLLLRFIQAGSSDCDLDECRPSDFVIAEMLLKAGATDITLSDQTITHIMNGPPAIHNHWTLLEMLVKEGNVRNCLIKKCRNCYDDILFPMVLGCGQPDSNGKYGYTVLESCLKGGLGPGVLRHGLKLTIVHASPKAVLLWIKAGADVNFEFTDIGGNRFTPFLLALKKVTEALNTDKMSGCPIYSGVSQVIEKCATIDSQFTILWLLAKTGAIRTWSRDIGCHLAQFEVSLRSVNEKVDRLSWERNWSLEHHSAAQNHLQRCFDILKEIQPEMNLLAMCRIAVRQALGPGLEDKLEQLELPVTLKDCILHHDLQAFVDAMPTYEVAREWTLY